jgi:hypothetical protein
MDPKICKENPRGFLERKIRPAEKYFTKSSNHSSTEIGKGKTKKLQKAKKRYTVQYVDLFLYLFMYDHGKTEADVKKKE